MRLVAPEEFESFVADALDKIPPELASHFSNVVVLVADENEAEPGLLGLYEGIALTERADYTFAMPDTITLYRIPLCRYAEGIEDLIEQIAVTVVHEFAHHVGIGDDRLRELGWD